MSAELAARLQALERRVASLEAMEGVRQTLSDFTDGKVPLDPPPEPAS